MKFANESTPPRDPSHMASFWHDSASRTEGTLHWRHIVGGWYRVTASEETSMGGFVQYVDPNVVFPKPADEGRPPSRRQMKHARRVRTLEKLAPWLIAATVYTLFVILGRACFSR